MNRDPARQHTLGAAVGAAGVGLHSGEGAKAVIRPAPPGTGVVFRRTDLDRPLDDCLVPARADFVAETRLGVTLRNRAGVEAATIEHLLAALFLCGVDNAVVELDGPEAPILDGSGARWAGLVQHSGVVAQDAPRPHLVVDRPYRVESGDRFVEIAPFDGRRVEVFVDYAEAAIGKGRFEASLDDPEARRRILAARTFCARKDVEAMQAAGLALGGSLDNAIVVDGAKILNEGGLRDPDEFVLHKTLDLIGDLALVGAPLVGVIRARKSGHDLHTALARLLLRESRKAAKPDFAGSA